MRCGSKTPIAALAVLLLVLGAAACGSDDDSDTATGTAQQQAGGDGLSDRGRSEGSGGDQDDSGAPEEPAGGFKPKQHEDSGGGSGRLRAKGGDDSVRSFGQEATEKEFVAAAVALHNFLDARAEGYWAPACSYLAQSVVELFEKFVSIPGQPDGRDCAEILAELTDQAAEEELREEAARADARSLRLKGERAFLIYTDADDAIRAFPMVRRNGRWNVAGIAGMPLD